MLLPIDGWIICLRFWAEFYRTKEADVVGFISEPHRRVRPNPEGQLVQFSR